MGLSQREIKKLNKKQKEGNYHPYTCMGSGGCVRAEQENDGLLIATKKGWVCPCGKYAQKFGKELGFMLGPEPIIIGAEIIRKETKIREYLNSIANINTDSLESSSLLNKINHEKKYIRALNFFNEKGVALLKNREGIYSFYVQDEMEYQYSPKTRKIKRPGSKHWNVIQRVTLERILRGEIE